MLARVSRPMLPPNRRILAISDIHGNLPYFRGLLNKVNFSKDDILFILGDIIEKGPYSLETLRYVMELCETHTVYPLCGNCDGWHRLIYSELGDPDGHMRRYIVYANSLHEGIIAQMCHEADFPLSVDMDIVEMRRALLDRFEPELRFLSALPHIIDTENYTFVHGGIPRQTGLEQLDAGSCMKNDNFMNQGRIFERWCIVGHWPVMLYGRDRVCANPIIDRRSKIISIDGGCVLKDDGQLNALIIPENGSEDFSFASYDPFPVRRAASAQAEGDSSYYIRWGDNAVRVLERGNEFSLCEHIRTGYRMRILNRYLMGNGVICRCNDSTDRVLEINEGDELSVVEETDEGLLVKRNGYSGWYFGSLY